MMEVDSMFAKDIIKFDMTKRFDNDNHYGKPDKYIHENIIMDNTLFDVEQRNDAWYE